MRRLGPHVESQLLGVSQYLNPALAGYHGRQRVRYWDVQRRRCENEFYKKTRFEIMFSRLNIYKLNLHTLRVNDIGPRPTVIHYTMCSLLTSSE